MAEVAGSNPAEPTSIFKSAARIKAEDENNKVDELCNFEEKLCNSDTTHQENSAEGIMTDRWYDEDGNMHIYMDVSEVVPEDWDEEDKDDPYLKKALERETGAVGWQRDLEKVEPSNARLTLSFTRSELDQYVAHRNEGLADKSQDWINRASHALWECTHGEVSQTSMAAMRTFALEKYSSIDSHRKVLGFATAFLKHLAKTQFEPRFQSFDLFLEPPKAVRVRKAVTERIVTREDIVQALGRIDAAEKEGNVVPQKVRNYRAFTLLASYTGLRPSTIKRLTIGQFRTAIKEDKPVLHILAEQEKNRVEHYVPLHPVVLDAVSAVLTQDFEGTDDETPFFMFNSFEKWLERQNIPLPRVRDPSKAHLWLSDFRKFAEQLGDIIGWDATNRKYVLAHGMTGVDWAHYKHPLPEYVFDIYLRSWGDIDLTS